MSSFKSRLKRNTFFYDIYLFFFNRSYYRYRIRERIFFGSLIRSGCLVYDVGANLGDKTDVFRRLGANVVSLEPDLSNITTLERRFKRYRGVTILPYAVGDAEGTARFYIENPGSAYNTLSVKWKETLENVAVNRWEESKSFANTVEVKTVTLDSIIARYGRPFLIKIDVEGYEWPCISGLSQRIPIISFEANLPEFLDETLKIVDRLQGMDPEVRFNYIFSGEKFEAAEPMPADQLRDVIRGSGLRYLEIYSFMKITEP